MNILSVFDGMACGMLAMIESRVNIDKYVAYEIDPYAKKTAYHNFPIIEEMGDVFTADFTQYKGFDYLVGGSPCTHWSIAQTKNRETTASGIGWDLFQQYVRALREAEPRFFIYENNKSMSQAIRESISETFGFEPICINSALVSAQNRQRLYWVGSRQRNGSYKKVEVEQPIDRGIMLRDILETNYKPLTEKEMDYMVRDSKGKYSDRWAFLQKPEQSEKSMCIPANIHKGVPYNIVAEPVCVAQRGRYPDNPKLRKSGLPTEQMYEAREDYKTNTLTTVQKDNMVAVPINTLNDSGEKSRTLMAGYYKYGTATLITNEGFKGETTAVAEPVRVGTMPSPDGTLKGGQAMRVYSTDGKGVTLKGQGGGSGAKTGLYAEKVPECFTVKEATQKGYTEIEPGYCVDMSMPNSKTRRGRNMKEKSNCLQTTCQFFEYCGMVQTPIYRVENGLITVKGKQYPIKLIDGYYIIRKLTVRECMRLQTVPEWYEFPVSDSQAYKMLGNGWTVSVISHLINATLDVARR